MTETDELALKAEKFCQTYDVNGTSLAEQMADFHLAQSAEITAENKRLKDFSRVGELETERDRLKEWVNGLQKAWWRDGDIVYRGKYGYALFDCSGSIIEHYPTAYEALTAYLKGKGDGYKGE